MTRGRRGGFFVLYIDKISKICYSIIQTCCNFQSVQKRGKPTMSRFSKLKSSKSVASTMFMMIAAFFISQVPVACANPADASSAPMDREVAREYCEEHEPDFKMECMDVRTVATKEQALNGFVLSFCDYMSRNVMTGHGGVFRMDFAPDGPSVVAVSWTTLVEKQSAYYNKVREQGFFPESAPKDFASALVQKNWWREGCWMFVN